MGFYGEDEVFCDLPVCGEFHSSSSNPAKRMRLDESIARSMEEYEKPAFDDVLDKLGSLETNEELEPDLEESAVRHEILRRIGLKKNPSRALRRYMKKVAEGIKPNPWVSNVNSEKMLRKKLRRFVLGLVVQACKSEGLEDCQLEESHKDAFKFIDCLNEELIQSLNAVGNFSSEQLRCAKNNCQKAFVARNFAGALLSQIPGDYTHCQVPECSHTTETHDDVNYLIVEGGLYSKKLEMPDNLESRSELLCMCSFHNGIYEFMFDIIHMKWNVYHNCLVRVRDILKTKPFKDSDDVIDEFPSNVLRSLVHFYMARYFCLWAFGDNEMWNKNGFTLFQALFGSE